jgi:hypothetical protein
MGGFSELLTATPSTSYRPISFQANSGPPRVADVPRI